MKTIGSLLAVGLWAYVGYAYFHRDVTVPRPANNDKVYAAPEREKVIPRSSYTDGHSGGYMASVGGGGHSAVWQIVQLGTGEVRKFEVHVEHVEGQQAVAYGSFYDIDPSITTFPEQLGTEDKRWTSAGRFMVFGLPEGLVDRSTWRGWLKRRGVSEYTDTRNGEHTVASYDVADEPEPKAATTTASDWQKRFGKTMADIPATRAGDSMAATPSPFKRGWGTALDQPAKR